MVRAFNDFLAEDYCSVAPDRLIGNAVMPASGIEDAIAELKRDGRSACVRSASVRSPTDRSAGTRGRPVLAVRAGSRCADHGPLRHGRPFESASGPISVGTFDLEMSMLSRTMPPPVVGIVRMILSGVLDRFPDLRIYFAETNASWMPGLLYMLDHPIRSSSTGTASSWRCARAKYIWRHFSFGIVRDPFGAAHARPVGHRSHHVGFGLPAFGLVLPRVSALVGRDLRGVPGRCPSEGPCRHAVRVLRARPCRRADADAVRLTTALGPSGGLCPDELVANHPQLA